MHAIEAADCGNVNARIIETTRRRPRRRSLLAWRMAVAAALAILIGAGAPAHADLASVTEPQAFPVSPLSVSSRDGALAFRVEVAVTPGQLALGLQGRETLAADAGMLFDFGRPRVVTMWMKNTHIPLDMLFIDAHGCVSAIAERTRPLSLETISSQRPVRAVLEVNAGTVARHAIRIGDCVEHAIFTSRP